MLAAGCLSTAIKTLGATRRGGGRLLVPVPEGDSPLGEIVRRQLDVHPVTSENANVMLAHFSGHVRDDVVAVFEPDAKARVGHDFVDDACHLDGFFLGHVFPLSVKSARERRFRGR